MGFVVGAVEAPTKVKYNVDMVREVSHLQAKVALTELRDQNTAPGRLGFALASDRAARFLAAEVTKDMLTTHVVVETPLAECQGHRFDAPVVLLPVLRAGLALQDPFWELLPHARIHHIGIRREESTAQPQRYYPPEVRPIKSDDLVVVIDPMLATGGTACDVLDEAARFQPREIRLATIICAPEGIVRVQERHPDVRIYTLAVDDHLNEHWYIVPGLGDYGDRYFGTV